MPSKSLGTFTLNINEVELRGSVCTESNFLGRSAKSGPEKGTQFYEVQSLEPKNEKYQLTSPLQATRAFLLRNFNGNGRVAGQIVRWIRFEVVTCLLAQHFAVFAITSILTTRHIRRDVVIVVKSATWAHVPLVKKI